MVTLRSRRLVMWTSMRDVMLVVIAASEISVFSFFGAVSKRLLLPLLSPGFPRFFDTCESITCEESGMELSVGHRVDRE